MANIPPISLTYSNLLKYLSLLTPFLLSFYIVISNILTNTPIKAIIYLFGVIMLSTLNTLLKGFVKSYQSPLASPLCNVLPYPFTQRDNTQMGQVLNSPSLVTTILSFTLSFMVYPMIINKEVNSAFLMFMIILIIINISVELSGYCSNLTGIIFGIISGGFIGIIYYLLLESSGYGEIAYMTQFNTNNIQCGKAGTQKFRCTKKK
tara:strand:- start:603 stop:1220 length:618 start_codon:yes stop_codon:yes gene_type:complete